VPKLPHLSGDEIVRAFERLGFVRARQKGSHVIMKRGPSGCVIPPHREVKAGTPAGVVRQAGVSAEEFLSAL
jgi:predicted RNA binding protein YcfA (HicA-like mRNA interferase family)